MFATALGKEAVEPAREMRAQAAATASAPVDDRARRFAPDGVGATLAHAGGRVTYPTASSLRERTARHGPDPL